MKILQIYTEIQNNYKNQERKIIYISVIVIVLWFLAIFMYLKI